MKALLIIIPLFIVLPMTYAQQKQPKILPREVQIKAAVMAAPEDKRAGAKVYGYTPDGEFTVLREGTNDFICLAPDIKQSGSYLYTYAYPKSLDPFMARGRELIAEGKRSERDAIREAEIKAGKLHMPKGPSTLYGYWGKAENLNPETGEILDAKRRYVIYIPYAKAEDLGLPNKPDAPGIPWLMDEGTYKAHIMINPENMGHQH